jgi:Ni/Co efflux regulator RcnB
MTPEEVVSLFRTEMVDEATPPLWSDAELFSHLNDAQIQFCRITGGLPDATTALTTVDIPIGLPSFKYDERILKIRDAYRTSDGKEIRVVNFEDMEKMGMRFNGRTGPFSAIIIGMDEDQVIPYPIPSKADTLKMVIDRLPLCDITADNASSAKLEIKKHHHKHLLHWMKKLAYEKQDAETFNKSKSKEFEQKFLDYCDGARKEKDRRKHHARVVAYGGLATRAPVSREDMDY